MTFKQFKDAYIKAYQEKKAVEVPATMWEDRQEIYDTLLKQSDLALKELNSNDKLTFKERIDAVALIDFCTIRCANLINDFSEVCKIVIDYNNSLTDKKS